MATMQDIEAAVSSALTEIGVTGRLDVRMDGSRGTSWLGQPTGDDHEIVVAVQPLDRSDG